MRATLRDQAAEIAAPASERAAPPHLRSRVAAPALAACLTAALVLVPFLLARADAPHDFVFRGTLKPSGDESQYLAALQMGAGGDWLWHDPYMARPPGPILMYPVYTAAGHLGALLRLDTVAGFALLHALAAVILCLALWRLAAEALPERDRPWLAAFGLGAGGLYWLVALLATAGAAPVALNHMGSQGLSGFTALLMEAHEALGVAGQILALGGLLGALRRSGVPRAIDVACGFAGVLLVGLSLPVLLPLTLAVISLCTVSRLRSSYSALAGRDREEAATAVAPVSAMRPQSQAGDRSRRAGPGTYVRGGLRRAPGRRASSILCLGIVALPGVALALYYARLFGSGPWAAGQFRGVPAIPLPEQALSWGVLLPFAAWGWWRAAPAARPVATALAIWACCALAGAQLPFWQGSRLAVGMAVACGALFALGLFGAQASRAMRLRWLVALALGPLCQYLFLLTALAGGNAPQLYSTASEDRADRWLAVHAGPGDIVLAPFGFSNVLPTAAPVRVVAGHTYQTLDLPLRLGEMQRFYGAGQSMAAREAALRATDATLVVYDALDTEDGPFTVRPLPGLQRVFDDSQVAVFRVVRVR